MASLRLPCTKTQVIVSGLLNVSKLSSVLEETINALKSEVVEHASSPYDLVFLGREELQAEDDDDDGNDDSDSTANTPSIYSTALKKANLFYSLKENMRKQPTHRASDGATHFQCSLHSPWLLRVETAHTALYQTSQYTNSYCNRTNILETNK